MTECQEAWTKECRGATCPSCEFFQGHAYEANRQGEGRCPKCQEFPPCEADDHDDPEPDPIMPADDDPEFKRLIDHKLARWSGMAGFPGGPPAYPKPEAPRD